MTPTLLAGLLLAVLLGTIEWRRADRANRPLRLGLVVLAAWLLAWLATPAGPHADAESGGGPRASIASLDAPTEVAVGEELTVRGRVTLAVADSAWVRLADPAGTVDSALVTGTSPEFALTARPRAAGALPYRVVLLAPGGGADDSIGVAVRAEHPPALLILDGSPNFETAYLKRWLASRGAAITLRTTLTRGRARVERLNGSADADGSLTPGILQRFDAVVTDSAALASLSAAELQTLSRAVSDSGLGILLTATTTAVPFFASFTLRPVDSSAALERRVGHPAWRGMPRRSRTGIEVAPSPLRERPGLEPLVRDETGAWLAAARGLGAGRIAVSLVRTPSRWQMGGETDLFSGYWSVLLSAVARDTGAAVRVEAGAPHADRRADLSLITTAARPTVSLLAPDGAATPVALARDPFEPNRWRGSVWPRSPGWHALRLGDRTVPILVHAAPDDPRLIAPASERPRPDAIVAFLLLLLSLTTLWLESRRRIGG